jgi:hypothetical protein
MSQISCWTRGPNWGTSPLPWGEGGPPPAFFSRGGPGLRPPKGYARSGQTIRYGPQAGEGSVAQPSHLSGLWVGETIVGADHLPAEHACGGKRPPRPATTGESAVAGHPLPKGEGCVRDLAPLCPAEDMGNGQPQGRGLVSQLTPRSAEDNLGHGQAPVKLLSGRRKEYNKNQHSTLGGVQISDLLAKTPPP